MHCLALNLSIQYDLAPSMGASQGSSLGKAVGEAVPGTDSHTGRPHAVQAAGAAPATNASCKPWSWTRLHSLESPTVSTSSLGPGSNGEVGQDAAVEGWGAGDAVCRVGITWAGA